MFSALRGRKKKTFWQFYDDGLGSFNCHDPIGLGRLPIQADSRKKKQEMANCRLKFSANDRLRCDWSQKRECIQYTYTKRRKKLKRDSRVGGGLKGYRQLKSGITIRESLEQIWPPSFSYSTPLPMHSRVYLLRGRRCQAQNSAHWVLKRDPTKRAERGGYVPCKSH